MPPTAIVDPADTAANPLDTIEQIIGSNGWSFDRRGEFEVTAEVSGQWSDYTLYFNWSAEMSAMHFTCAFNLKVPERRRAAFHELLALSNERLWIGHFGMGTEDSIPAFHHSVLLRGTAGASQESLEDMLDIALAECERFYPAFQFTISAGKPAAESLAAAMLECAGEA